MEFRTSRRSSPRTSPCSGPTSGVDVARQVVVVVTLVDDVAPRGGDRGRVDPRLEGHPRRQPQRRASGIVTRAVVPLKESAFPNLPWSSSVAVPIAPPLPFPEASATVVPRALVEGVGGDEATRRCRRRRARGGRVGAEVGDGVGRAHAVGVARRGAAPGVVVGRPRRLRDLGEVRAAGALAALDPVAGDADVVGRRRPGEVDLGRADRASPPGWRRGRRLRVRRCRRRRARGGRVGAEVGRRRRSRARGSE